MGIHGLLPFLKKACTPINIKEFKGCSVAIDTYCWLHKGAFSCADKLAKGEKTDQYVFYCIKYVNTLISYGIRPILVFDGCHLPSKKQVEKTRRERRESNRKKGKEFLREGRLSEARDCFQKSVDVTPEMALEVMEACRDKGVDCIVAPYEADSQLGYLYKSGIVQLVVTEDSDLVLFGCDKILFKMDLAGNGILYDGSNLAACLTNGSNKFTFDKFRYMCIMAGCDYLPSLPGIGLGKALKFFSRTNSNDLRQVLKKIPVYLNMHSLDVSSEYIEGFIRANETFLYQLVFDPIQRQLVPLNPYSSDVNPEEMDYAGPWMSNEKALQIALGNINVNTFQRIANFNPDKSRAPLQKCKLWSDIPIDSTSQHYLSIWSSKYKPNTNLLQERTPQKQIEHKTTLHKEINVNTNKLIPKKKATLEKISVNDRGIDAYEDDLDIEKLTAMYSTSTSTPSPKPINSNYSFNISCNKNDISPKNSTSEQTKKDIYSRFFGKPLSTVSPDNMNKPISCLNELEKEYMYCRNDRRGKNIEQSLTESNQTESEQISSYPVSSLVKKPSKSVFNWSAFEYRFPKKFKLDHPLNSSPVNHTGFKPVCKIFEEETLNCSQSSKDSGLETSFVSDNSSLNADYSLSLSQHSETENYSPSELCDLNCLNNSIETKSYENNYSVISQRYSDVQLRTNENVIIDKISSKQNLKHRILSVSSSGKLTQVGSCKQQGLKKHNSLNKQNSGIKESLMKFAFVKSKSTLESMKSTQVSGCS